MDKNLHDIEDLFRRGLEDNEEMPPENTWDGIEKILDKDKVISIRKKYLRLKWVAILLLFFSVGMSLYVWNTRKNNNPEKKNSAILKKEIEPKNNAAPTYGGNQIDVKKPVDSINATADNDLKKEPKLKNNAAPTNEDNKVDVKKPVDSTNASVGNVLRKEVKSNNNAAPSHGNNQTGLKKRVDSANTIVIGNNQNPVKEIATAKVDKNIAKKQPEEKQAKSSITKSISNLAVSKEDRESEKNTKRDITKNLSNSSISKQEKEKENKPDNEFNINTPAYHEDELDVAAKLVAIDSNKNLPPLIQLHSLPLAEVKSSTTDLIDTKKILNATVLSSKNKFKQSKNLSPFSITGFYSRDKSFFHLQDNPSGNPNTNGVTDENGETETSAHTFGALIDFKPGRHWSLQSGLTLSTTHIDIEFEDEPLYAVAVNTGNVKYRVNTVLGYGYILPSFSNNPNVGDTISSLSTTNTLQYLGIPLAVKYSFDKGKFSINAMAGISGNFLTKGKIETEVELGNDNEFETVTKIYGLKKFYMSGLAGVSVDYNFYKNLSLSFAPTLRFALNPINENTPVISYPNSLEFSLGLKMKL